MTASISAVEKAVANGRRLVWECIKDTVRNLTVGKSSESDATSLFLERLGNHLTSRYWYASGSHADAQDICQGTIVVFGQLGDALHFNFANARLLRPRSDLLWSGMAYFYASPLIEIIDSSGQRIVTACDFGLTYYQGHSTLIIDDLRARAALQRSVVNTMNVTNISKSNELFDIYAEHSSAHAFSNIARGISAQLKSPGDYNIGHSLPIVTLDTPDWYSPRFRECYASKRKYISESSFWDISQGFWTLESRDMRSGSQLAISFHEIFTKSTKEWKFVASSLELAAQEMPWLL